MATNPITNQRPSGPYFVTHRLTGCPDGSWLHSVTHEYDEADEIVAYEFLAADEGRRLWNDLRDKVGTFDYEYLPGGNGCEGTAIFRSWKQVNPDVRYECRSCGAEVPTTDEDFAPEWGTYQLHAGCPLNY